MKRSVYFIASDQCGTVKIGKSDNITRRMRDIRMMCSDKYVYLLGFIECRNFENADWLERRLHTAFRKYSSHGEWFFLNEITMKAIEKIILTVTDEQIEEEIREASEEFINLVMTDNKRFKW